jgi:hypothetical protein
MFVRQSCLDWHRLLISLISCFPMLLFYFLLRNAIIKKLLTSMYAYVIQSQGEGCDAEIAFSCGRDMHDVLYHFFFRIAILTHLLLLPYYF